MLSEKALPGPKEGLGTVCSRVQSGEGLVNWRKRGEPRSWTDRWGLSGAGFSVMALCLSLPS